ncbi:hypothetical protein EVAR_49317_1 [Eumeta japonica]|uniref:Uncharacterized protein n=1 Tax=Eumeta variegata TaxID=151549 RepID=A0A4C1YB17_EUMVA|nr:hypothetical protein EVAR_49317_1 [Eumeta japonica]
MNQFPRPRRVRRGVTGGHRVSDDGLQRPRPRATSAELPRQRRSNIRPISASIPRNSRLDRPDAHGHRGGRCATPRARRPPLCQYISGCCDTGRALAASTGSRPNAPRPPPQPHHGADIGLHSAVSAAVGGDRSGGLRRNVEKLEPRPFGDGNFGNAKLLQILVSTRSSLFINSLNRLIEDLVLVGGTFVH